MFAALTRLLPAASTMLRQIVAPVIATLIAAVLIQGYNRAFSGQLSQPRMAAVQAGSEQAALPAVAPTATADAIRVGAAQSLPVTDYITLYERAAPDRLSEKDGGREAAKDDAPIKLATPAAAPATAPAAAPAARAAPARSAAVQPAARQPRAPRAAAPIAATPPVTTSIAVAPVPAEPPPVIVAAPPQAYGIARQGANEPPVTEAPPPPRGALGAIANALSPSALFARAREFGQKIEQTGNDLLPNIRQ